MSEPETLEQIAERLAGAYPGHRPVRTKVILAALREVEARARTRADLEEARAERDALKAEVERLRQAALCSLTFDAPLEGVKHLDALIAAVRAEERDRRTTRWTAMRGVER